MGIGAQQKAIISGYKQTEMGVVPEDWQLSTLGDLCRMSSGTTPARKMYERYYRAGTIPWTKTLDLNNSEIHSTEEAVTSLALEETSLRRFSVGTVLLAMYGGFNQIGRTGLLRISAAVNQAITAIEPKPERLSSEYLLAFLNFRVNYWKSVASSSRKDPNITGQDVRNFPILHPQNVAEQEIIAAALSDVDAQNGALDMMIAKKRDLKQAAMQQLLTGKRRLPGFTGQWKQTTLGEIGECVIGLTYKPENVVQHGLLVLRSSNVQNGHLAFEDNVYVNVAVQEKLITREGDILICVRNGSRALIGKCAMIDERGAGLTFGAFMSIYRTKYSQFIFHAFQSHDIQRQIRWQPDL